MVKHITTIGDWTFEVIQVRARKTNKHKDPYTAVATISIVDGIPHIEGLLSSERLHISDYTTLLNFIKDLGLESVSYTKAVKV